MPSPFHPEGLHGPRTSLVHGQAVGEIDHLVFGTVDYQHRRGYFRDLVNAGEMEKKRNRAQLGALTFTPSQKASLTIDTRPSYHCTFLSVCKMLELCPRDMEPGSLPKCTWKQEPALPSPSSHQF